MFEKHALIVESERDGIRLEAGDGGDIIRTTNGGRSRKRRGGTRHGGGDDLEEVNVKKGEEVKNVMSRSITIPQLNGGEYSGTCNCENDEVI